MNLKTLIFTNNDCYKAGKKHTVKGIVVHSTGANNPNLKRYVGPDDGLLGVNSNNNHWNQAMPDGRQVCVHGFIGKLTDGSIATYQTLPWDMVGWHSGAGDSATAAKNGFSGNNANYLGYVGFEICEDALADKTYFDKVYDEAVGLCAYLCKTYNIKPEKPYLICHSEGHALGIASNHGDVMHWFPKFGKSMDTFRAAVKAAMGDGSTAPAPETPTKPAPSGSFKVGDVVRFTSGAVYVSSAAATPAHSRGKSLCKVTQTAANGKHPYHLISEDKCGVYGWVDAIDVTAVGDTSAPAFTAYTVKVTTNVLNIRKGPGTNYDANGSIKDKGVYTIVEEADGTGASKWGKLKSGAGWISLDYAEKR